MERSLFEKNLREATRHCHECAASLVTDALPDSVRFIVRPNSSFDGNPLEGDEVVFPNDGERSELDSSMDSDQVVEFFWRGGKVPEWIDLSVVDYDEWHTYVELLACGRFTAMTEHLYHIKTGMPPFSPKSPSLPLDWESVETSGRFQLRRTERRN